MHAVIARTIRKRANAQNVKQWRARFVSLNRTRVRNILVIDARSMADLEAAQYVACTDCMFLVVTCQSGAIAAFADGEFRGWHPTVDIAVSAIHPDR